MSSAAEAGFETLTLERISEVVAIEHMAYDHPWTERNFADSLKAGYNCQLLVAGPALLGYFVAMQGVDEVHLLNITVAPLYQRQGWSSVLMEGLAIWSRGQGAQCLWLEVRAGNYQALAVYEHMGFVRVGRRKDYYPAGSGQREDAVVMSKTL
jgi:ribosomal-protein-alanine N-acetyltransferase